VVLRATEVSPNQPGNKPGNKPGNRRFAEQRLGQAAFGAALRPLGLLARRLFTVRGIERRMQSPPRLADFRMHENVSRIVEPECREATAPVAPAAEQYDRTNSGGIA
jgi:hypothetical protein